MFLQGLDEIDRKIVELLVRNARISYVDIGEQVGLSRVAVKARIQALEKQGVIEEYTTIINPQKISDSVSAYFELELEPAAFYKVVNLLSENDTVTQVYHVTGNSRLHVHAVADSQEHFECFLKDFLYQLPGVRDLRCNIIISRMKDVKGLRL